MVLSNCHLPMTTSPTTDVLPHMNPLTGAPTQRVLFGYLNIDLGVIHAVNERGRPDEDRVIGIYRGGSGDPEPPMGRCEGEAVTIDGKSHPICTGMYNKFGRRTHGVVLIDATNL